MTRTKWGVHSCPSSLVSYAGTQELVHRLLSKSKWRKRTHIWFGQKRYEWDDACDARMCCLVRGGTVLWLAKIFSFHQSIQVPQLILAYCFILSAKRIWCLFSPYGHGSSTSKNFSLHQSIQVPQLILAYCFIPSAKRIWCLFWNWFVGASMVL